MGPQVAGSRRVLNVEPSPGRERDWPVSRARADGLLGDERPPDALDLTRNRGWYRIGDQGETGSCVGWALADSVMRWQLVRQGRLRPNQRLSVRFIWMAAKELRAKRLAEEGHPDWRPSTFLEEAATSVKDGLEVARRFGAVTEPVLRWDGALNRGAPEEFYARAAELKLVAYHSLDHPEPEPTFAHWRQWLHQRGPVLLVIEVDRSFASGEPALERFRRRRRAEGHACALVGYRGDRFLLRNSWGSDWGRRGYAWASPEWLRGAFSESYGVVT